MKVALWGAGLLGKPIVLRLSKFYEVIVSNRTYDKVLDLEQKGIKVLNFDESLKFSDLIILVLTDYKAIEETLLKNKNLLFRKNIIQMGTILPDESKYLHQEITNYGGNYIEAPVLGSGREAEGGKLIIMISGLKDVVEKCKDIFGNLGKIYYLGNEIGKASTLKLALNQLIASLTVAFSYSLSLIMKEKIDCNVFMDILRNSALYAPTFDKKLNKMLENDFSNPNFPLKHLLKDVQLIRKVGNKLNLNNVAINSIEKILEKAINLDYSNEDYSALFKVIKNEV
ncbi:MAG: 3-hydroxyisobutyrate dehydrogenase [Candidatus Sericytochromatia bacterium]|nr:MAG: 3-hydroxyisobutyrate dehydrogenase [Candidatus Sericytochromatia bacterium]